MIKRYTCDIDLAVDVRDRQIREIAAEMIGMLISRSDLRAKDRYSVHVNVRKVRNRSKDATTEEYIISAAILL